MNAIIIEDEDLTAEDLHCTLKRLDPSIELLTRLSSVKESVAYFRKKTPVDLIFSDIQLGDGQSFEIFKTIPPPAPIVFCTAYNDYMMEAFQTFGLDYILKPFSDESIRKTLLKYTSLKHTFNKGTNEMLFELQNQTVSAEQRRKSIIVMNGDKIIPVQLSDVVLCYIEFDNVFVKISSGKEYLVNKSLDEMEQLLGGDFFRVNRQHILKREAIAYANMGLSRKLMLTLHVSHPIKISVSKEKSSTFLHWLEG
ncbi:response regulator transcription factor [Sphingobacterium olei]|uniref:Response regulator transcription factor n=1 Tax=Sphingobacterium olei TaxID=2571155 RepID=A0A4U0NZF2_9SPHI|nr:LytTR family DNA-binding domain-containing protein [Sphingobacterium olei]TJZ60120.1 response regulator transcription factor [Sphingobacterium olei]